MVSGSQAISGIAVKTGYFNFCNSEGMTSLPHNLVMDTQPRFGLIQSKFLNLCNFLINWRILMKIVAKCLAFVSLPYQVHVKVCNLIPLNIVCVSMFSNPLHKSCQPCPWGPNLPYSGASLYNIGL